MAQNPNQAITGNNSFNSTAIQITENNDFHNIPIGIHVCILSEDLLVSDLNSKSVTIPKGGYLTFKVGDSAAGTTIILLNLLSGNFKLFGVSSFIVTESW